MTARKVHRLTIAGLVLTAFVLGSFVSDWVGMAILAVTALMLLVGAFAGRADLVQQLVERRAIHVRPEPVGSARARHPTRVVEGAVCLLATGLVAAGAAHAGWGFDLAGWVLALTLAALMLLDGLFDVSLLGAAIQRWAGGE